MMRRTAVTAALVGLVMLGVGVRQARGANLLTNGDFETCDLTGWSLTGAFASVSTYLPHGGSCAMRFGAITDSILMQSAQIVTSPGAVCTFSFWLRNGDTTQDGNDFSASWDNGAPLVNLLNAPMFDYTKYTFMVTGTGSDNITFRASNVEDWYVLDDVSVECAERSPAPAVSARNTLVLAAVLLLLGLLSLRRLERRQ